MIGMKWMWRKKKQLGEDRISMEFGESLAKSRDDSLHSHRHEKGTPRDKCVTAFPSGSRHSNMVFIYSATQPESHLQVATPRRPPKKKTRKQEENGCRSRDRCTQATCLASRSCRGWNRLHQWMVPMRSENKTQTSGELYGVR